MNLIKKATISLALLLILSAGPVFAYTIIGGVYDGWDATDGVTTDGSNAMLKILDYEEQLTLITLSKHLTLSAPATISFDVRFDKGTRARVVPPTEPDTLFPENFFEASYCLDDNSAFTVFLGYNYLGPYDADFQPLSGTDQYGWYHFTGNIPGIDPGTIYFDLKDIGAPFYSTAEVKNVVLTESVTPVPEPSTLLLLGASIAGFMSAGLISIRRSKV